MITLICEYIIDICSLYIFTLLYCSILELPHAFSRPAHLLTHVDGPTVRLTPEIQGGHVRSILGF